MDHTWIADRIRATERVPQPGDALSACIVDALTCGTRIAYPPLPEPMPLPRALVEAMFHSTTWRD
jgi:hypothetical protein